MTAGTRLSSFDSALFHLEAGGHRVATIAVVVLEGPAPGIEAVRQRVETVLPRLPRLRARVRHVPLGLQRPVWEAVDEFDISYHVVEQPVDRPGGDRQLVRLVGRLLVEPFVPERPPWQIRVVHGLADGRWALASRIHLALIDELAAVDVLTAVLAPRVVSALPEQAEPQRASSARLFIDAARDLVTVPYEQVRAVNAIRRRLRRTPPQPPPAELHYRCLSIELAEVRRVRQQLGGSVNDVLAALVAAGVRAAEPSDAVSLMLPFAVRSLSRPGHYDNTVVAGNVDLHVGEADPATRYRLIAEALDQCERDILAIGGRLLARVAAPVPFSLFALGARACIRSGPEASLVNIPGSPQPATAFERAITDVRFVSPHPVGATWAITAVSYAGTINLGVTGLSRPPVEAMVRGMDRGIGELTGRP